MSVLFHFSNPWKQSCSTDLSNTHLILFTVLPLLDPLPCWKMDSVTEVTSSNRALIGGKWSVSLAKIWTIWNSRTWHQMFTGLIWTQIKWNCIKYIWLQIHCAGASSQNANLNLSKSLRAWMYLIWNITQLFLHETTTMSKNTFMSAYLSCEVQGWRLWNCAIHLPKHLTKLRYHWGKVVEQRLHRLLKDGAHSLRDIKRSAELKPFLMVTMTSYKSRAASISDSPLQPGSHWATYWVQSVWEQTLAAKPQPPEKTQIPFIWTEVLIKQQ